MADSFTSPHAEDLPGPAPHVENVPSPFSLLGVTEEPEAFQKPTKLVSVGFQAFLSLANVAFYLTLYPITSILLPLQAQIADPRNKVVALGIISTIGAIAAILGNPLAGALSDRTTSRFGRRRPWMVVGALLTALGLAVLANASTLLLVIIAWFFTTFFANVLLAALAAIIPDRVPDKQRATVSAIVALAIPFSLIFGVSLITAILTATKTVVIPYYTIIGLMLVIIGVYVVIYRDKPLPVGAMPPVKPLAFLTNFWISPRRYPDFGLAWITRFLVLLGYTIGIFYLFYYFQDVVKDPAAYPGHTAAGATAFVNAIAGICLIISTIIFGILSDRLQRRKIFVMGSSLMIAIGVLILAFSHSWLTAEIAAVIIGFGFGAYLAVDIALMTLVLPRAESRARDLGVLNIASALPSLFAPGVGAFVLNFFLPNFSAGYTVLFIIATVLVVLGAVLVQPIKSVR
ncbi:MAG: MFS transporter [Chloroflexota bacterium]|nr:MFS transporter [Chloroflexota bacterium]